MLAEAPDDGSMQKPEALRGEIRRILLESLPAGTVQWGKNLVSATRSAGDVMNSLSPTGRSPAPTSLSAPTARGQRYVRCSRMRSPSTPA